MAIFNDLPTELITEVFLNLEYFTLNLKVRRVCRRFNHIIENAAGPLLDKLFRGNHTAKPRKDGRQYCYTVHPCIYKIFLDLGEPPRDTHEAAKLSRDHYSSIDRVGFKRRDTGSWTMLKDTPVAKENALSATGVPIREFHHAGPRHKYPFVVCKGFHPGKVTVLDFVAEVISWHALHVCHISHNSSFSVTWNREGGAKKRYFTVEQLMARGRPYAKEFKSPELDKWLWGFKLATLNQHIAELAENFVFVGKIGIW